MAQQCFLVAVIGQQKAVLASCFAKTAAKAEAACAALFDDTFKERGEAIAFDTGAQPGIWIESDPAYMRGVIAA